MAQQRRRLTRKRIVDAALELAEREGWEAVRLHQIAASCDAGLDQIRAQFREKDELIDAWFDRADEAMLRRFDGGAIADLAPRERVRDLILTWLETLAPHHRVTREMIAHKLEPGHLHVQLPAVLRISRTVQWIREAALLDAPLPRRALEETALTALFVNTLVCWLRDRPPDFAATRRWLDRGLELLETLARVVPGGRFSGPERVDAAAGQQRERGGSAAANPSEPTS